MVKIDHSGFGGTTAVWGSPMTSATATVLFCDMAGSTDRRARLGEVAANEFFRRHERLLRSVVDQRAGSVLKGAGDGVMAVFPAASDGISAAIAIQQQVAEAFDDVEVRVGVAAGDVSWEDGDCFGMPVVVAARLERRCRPGRILVTAVVRHLAGDRVEADFRALEPAELKGVPQPVEVFEVDWRPLRGDDASTWRFASALPSRSTIPFVGRERELAELSDVWTDVVDGGRGLVLLSGEAGVGKTRLATEFARDCHEDGAIVVCGLCDRELSLAYAPWVMVLDELIAQLPDSLLESMRNELDHLRVLVPGIDQFVAGLPGRDGMDPETARHRMFAAVADVLGAASELAPTVVVLEDLQWAGGQTLALLRFLQRTRPVRRCLVVATLRDADDEIGDALASALADFHRDDDSIRIKVDGFDDVAVEQILRAASANGDVRARASAITRRTGGNAFLVSELVRAGDDRVDLVPDSVRDVVGQRLSRLGEQAQQVARTIAIGGRVELPVLVAAGADEATTRSALEQLLGTGLVEELDLVPPAYHFAHDLIRDAVHSVVPAHERVTAHRDLAIATEQVFETDRRPVLASLARHFTAAAPVVGWEKAAYYGRRAAAHARRSAAYEEAIDLLESSLSVTPSSTPERAMLLIQTVDLHQRCGRNLEALTLAEEADELARELDDVRLGAHASIEIERAAHLANAHFERSPPRLQYVLERSERLDDELRIRVQASLGRARSLVGAAGGAELVADAIADSRSLDDGGDALSHALEMACVTERDPRRALGCATELERVTTSRGDVFRSMWAMTRQTDALLTFGRLAEAEVVLNRLRESSARYRFTNYRLLALWFTHALALAAADFELSEQAAEASNTDTEFARINADGAYGLQMFMIRRAQGRLEEIRPVLEVLARNSSAAKLWQPGLVAAQAELGMLDAARSGFETLMADRCATIPRDTLWPLTLRFLSDTCDVLDDSAEAVVLLDELERFAGLTLRAGYTTTGGPSDRARAVMAQLADRPALADELIGSAYDLARHSGSPLWLVEVELSWARILERRGEPAAASLHLERARSTAASAGIGLVPDDTGTEPSGTSAETEPPHGLTEREVEVLRELARGMTNRQIAASLFISPNTAANHVRSILQKTGLSNRTEAAGYAFQNGLVDLDP